MNEKEEILMGKSILFVANVDKEHILKFHLPTIKYFKDNGWNVDVACAGNEEIPFCDKRFNMVYKRSPFTLDTLKGIFQLKKILKNNHYDIIYCHTPVGGFVGRIASISQRKKGTKVVYFTHGFHFFKGAPIANWLVYYPIEKILSNFTDTIISLNNEDYNNSVNKLKCKSVFQVDGIGIDVDLFRNVDKPTIRKQYRDEFNIPQDADVLIYLAELSPNKNQPMLIRVLKQVLSERENTFLMLAGIDHNNGKDLEYAKQLGVLKNVLFLGWRNDKQNLYAAADICTASSIREGFGLNIVEAMASGLPIVATKNRGHCSIINAENGFLVDFNQENEMAKIIINILSNKNEFTSEKLCFDIEKYSTKKIAQKLFDILNHLSD